MPQPCIQDIRRLVFLEAAPVGFSPSEAVSDIGIVVHIYASEGKQYQFLGLGERAFRLHIHHPLLSAEGIPLH